MAVLRSDVVVVRFVWSRFILLVHYWSDSDGSENCKKNPRTTLKTEKASFSETLLSNYSNYTASCARRLEPSSLHENLTCHSVGRIGRPVVTDRVWSCLIVVSLMLGRVHCRSMHLVASYWLDWHRHRRNLANVEWGGGVADRGYWESS
jgi:hypothetical protein